MIDGVDIPYPVDYLPTGDHALLVAWTSSPPIFFVGGPITREQAHLAAEELLERTEPRGILSLEDGSAVIAKLSEIKFNYRYDIKQGKFVDVSGFGAVAEEEEGVDADQDASDHGGAAVPGLVPDAD